MKSRQRIYEYFEGPEAAKRFSNGLNTVLQVSKDELAKREQTYQKRRRTRKARRPRSTP